MTTDEQQIEQQPMERHPFRVYLILIGVIWGLCALQVVAAKLIFRDLTGVAFFFAFIAVIFTAVAIYDWLYDAFALRKSSESRPDNIKSD